jgi:hypothetical protein
VRKPPPVLYKYLSSERADVIRDRRIRFSQLAAFNDPLESSAFTGPLPEDRPLQDVIDDVFRAGQSNRAVEPDDVLKAFGFSFANVLGVLSLSEDPLSLLMWAHYAERHEGLVLGLAAEHPFFRPEGHGALLDDDMGVDILRAVTYQTARHSAMDQVALAMSDEAPFTKSPEWSYEKEWRIRKHKENAVTTLAPQSTFPVWLLHLPPDCVFAVILGCRMRPSVRKAVAEYLSDKDYEHVQLYQAWPHPVEYRLQLVPITLETIMLPQQKLVIRNVPEAQVDSAVARCVDHPALKVERLRQPDPGLWTVVATAIVGRGLGKEGAEMDWSIGG